MKRSSIVMLTLILLAVWLQSAAGQERAPQGARSQETTRQESPQESPSAAGQDEELLRLSKEILEKVVELRGLEVKRKIEQEVRSRDQIRSFLVDKMALEYPDEELEIDQKIFRRLGLLSQEESLQSLILDLLTSQVAGFYDPVSKTFSIADWIPDAMQRPVMAHELLHALQDQHFDLENFFKQVEDDDDQVLARQAIVEGEGVAVMMDYMLHPMGQQFQNIPQLGRMIEQAQKAAPESAVLSATPAFLTDLLLFPYVQGANFLSHFRRDHSWDEMAGVYRDPPRSSEQILHPEKYFGERDDPTPVELSREFPEELKGEWRRQADGTLGQYMTSRLMTPFIDRSEAEEAARGWDGDRFEWLEAEDGRHALWVRTVWDSPEEARQFHEALVKTLRVRSGSAAEDAQPPGTEVVLREGGRVYKVRHEGDRVHLLDYDERP